MDAHSTVTAEEGDRYSLKPPKISQSSSEGQSACHNRQEVSGSNPLCGAKIVVRKVNGEWEAQYLTYWFVPHRPHIHPGVFMVESPCIKLCELNRTKEYCISCHRTLEQIKNWSKMTEEQKLAALYREPNFF